MHSDVILGLAINTALLLALVVLYETIPVLATSLIRREKEDYHGILPS
jgi:hypothetical protein